MKKYMKKIAVLCHKSEFFFVITYIERLVEMYVGTFALKFVHKREVVLWKSY